MINFSRVIFTLVLVGCTIFSTKPDAYEIPSSQKETTSEESSFYTIIPDKATTPLLSPTLQDRKTLKIKLANGLEAILISDPDAEQSAAALVVETGSWEEPDNHPGLAHFLEHMLFLGTKSYPEEGEYHQYIAQHGGLDNAFTMNDATAYIFSINNDAFEGALDRFSNFFKEPLLSPSGVSRELHAIDQEYAKNIENDSFRQEQVLKLFTRSDHPERIFHMGNSKSLSNTTPDTLREWFQKHYSSNIMKLAVYSNLPIDKLKQLVVLDFKDIPNNGRAPFHFDIPINGNDVSQSILFIEPVQNIRRLSIRWELPAIYAQMNDSHPERVLCYILGHEGNESLLAQLKRENLGTALSCGRDYQSREDIILYVEIELTEEGLKKYPLVVERVYQTLAMLKQNGIPRSIVEEARKQDQLDYQYQERRSAFKEAMYHAMRLRNEDIDTYPERNELITKYSQEDIENLISTLTPAKARIIITAPYRETRVKSTGTEPWMNVKYAQKSIPKAMMAQWESAKPHPAIKLPSPNPYLPENLALVSAAAASQKREPLSNRGAPRNPVELINNQWGTIYFAQDNLYHVPKSATILSIRTPAITPANPASIALSEVYAKCVKDSLDNAIYYAQLAGLNFTIKSDDNGNGIRLQVVGYNDKAGAFLETIADALKSPSCDETNFLRYKDSLLRSYADKTLDSPVEQSIDILKNIIYKDYATAKEKETALKKMTFDEYKLFVDKLYESNYIEGIFYGNLTAEQAQTAITKLRDSLGGNPYPKEKHFKKELLLLQPKDGPYFWEQTINAQGNATFLAIEAGKASYDQRAAQQILMQAIREPFFYELRTVQQTGYLVFSGSEEVLGELLSYFTVQSNTYDTRDLLARFELFIESYLREISTQIPQQHFEVLREALTIQMKQPPKELAEMAELFYELAFTYNKAFERPAQRIEAFENLTYDSFLDYARKTLGHANRRRLAILVRGTFPNQTPFFYERVRNRSTLREAGQFVSE